MRKFESGSSSLLLSTFVLACLSLPAIAKEDVSIKNVTTITKDWPARPRLAIQEMLEKYGEPVEVSSQSVVWHDEGPFKRIMVTQDETPHDFPKPHLDFIEHTINFNVPLKKIDDLIAFDSSITINKTVGEMSARCDHEGHNVLSLNIAKEIINGRYTVDQARKVFGDNVVNDVLGKNPAYLQKLTFVPPTEDKAGFADEPTIPGAPERSLSEEKGNPEILAFLIAADENEVKAAAQAETKEDISKEVKDYARMLHQEHGKNQKAVMSLGQKLKNVPADTAAVDLLKVKGATELAKLVPLDGKEFEKAYIDAMVKNHAEMISMIDTKLVPSTDNEEVLKQLQETKKHVSSHLNLAKKLQESI